MMPEAHSSFIKTPRQLIVVVLLSFIVPVIGILLLVKSDDDIASAIVYMADQSGARLKK